MLERRSRSSALLSSIISASRERKKEAGSLLSLEDAVAGIDDLTPATDTPYDEMSDDMSPSVRQQPSLAIDPRRRPVPSTVTAGPAAGEGDGAGEGVAVEAEAEASDGDNDDADDDEGDDDDDDDDDEEEGELVEDAQWEPRRTHPHGRDNGRVQSDSEEIVEASGVVVAAERPMPRIVSRRSQSRFGAMLTAVLDEGPSTGPAHGPAMAQGPAVSDPLRESALDRFVAEHPAARGPLSSHETLRICHTEASDGGQADAALDAHIGPQDEVLVGAAVWQRDDRGRVLRALHRLGADFAQVASLMPSKTTAQCRYFYYHYRTPGGALLSEVLSGASPQKAPAAAQPKDALVLPPAPLASSGPGPAEAGGPLVVAEQPAAKRARTQSPADSDDDDDDEMPLAAQLAEELAALHPLRLAPETAQPRAAAASPLAMASSSGLVLPRPAQSCQSPAQPASATTNNNNPSPHSATAKKSGYSSYWSVLERSAFMHHLSRLGQNWLALADAIGTKTGTQVRNYFRANQEKLGLDAVVIAYERNRAAGTLPPPEPFTPMSAKDDAQARKEKRGRKRKGDAQPSPRVGSPEESASISSMPSTAPATITSFPTIGVDGGRAVVVAYPPPAPSVATAPHPAAMDTQGPQQTLSLQAVPSRSLPPGPAPPRLPQWGRPPPQHSLPRPSGPALAAGHTNMHLVREPSVEMDPRIGVAG
ncbi:DNA-binding protein snt1, partial [Coemansia spiralis]